MDKALFRRRLLAVYAEAELEAPHEGVPNGVYLDHAWMKGVEFMLQKSLSVLDDMDQADQSN